MQCNATLPAAMQCKAKLRKVHHSKLCAHLLQVKSQPRMCIVMCTMWLTVCSLWCSPFNIVCTMYFTVCSMKCSPFNIVCTTVCILQCASSLWCSPINIVHTAQHTPIAGGEVRKGCACFPCTNLLSLPLSPPHCTLLLPPPSPLSFLLPFSLSSSSDCDVYN